MENCPLVAHELELCWELGAKVVTLSASDRVLALTGLLDVGPCLKRRER